MFLRAGKVIEQQVEFLVREGNLRHIQPLPQLGNSYSAAPQFVEISQELRDSHSLLLRNSPQFGHQVLEVIRLIIVDKWRERTLFNSVIFE